MESVEVDSLCPPPEPYSYAIKAGGAIYLARQVSLDRDGNIVGDTFGAQARQVWRNMSDGLDAAGGSPADVVKLIYHMQGIRETAVKAAALGLPGLLIEIDVRAEDRLAIESTIRAELAIGASLGGSLPAMRPVTDGHPASDRTHQRSH